MLQKDFFDIPSPFCLYEKAKAVILPVPFEKSVSYGKGTAKGPDAILKASWNVELYDDELECNIHECGISSVEPLKEKDSKDSASMIKKIEESCGKLLKDDKFPVMIGGEHSISQGMFSSLVKKYPHLSVVQLDAHSDIRDAYLEDKYSHASVMARIYEKIKEPKKSIQVGIRSCCDEEIEKIKKNNYSIFWARDIHDNKKWIKEAVDKLGRDVFITLDIDVFDPSIIPATGTPEPGGLGWYLVLDFLKEIFRQKNVVGFDVVELAPNKDSHVSNFITAKLIYKMIGYKFCLKK